MPGQKKHKLKVSGGLPFEALAISSAERDYRLCFHINRQLNFHFVRDGQLFVQDKQLGPVVVECYRFLHPDEKYLLYLCRNRQEGFFLAPAVKKADFLLLAHDPSGKSMLTELKNSLTQIPLIQATFALSPDQTKNICFEQ